MTELDFWRYGVIGAAFFLGFVIGCVFIIVREARFEEQEAREELRKVCGHGNSTYENKHPDFPWTCCDCGTFHDGQGRSA